MVQIADFVYKFQIISELKSLIAHSDCTFRFIFQICRFRITRFRFHISDYFRLQISYYRLIFHIQACNLSRSSESMIWICNLYPYLQSESAICIRICNLNLQSNFWTMKFEIWNLHYEIRLNLPQKLLLEIFRIFPLYSHFCIALIKICVYDKRDSPVAISWDPTINFHNYKEGEW